MSQRTLLPALAVVSLLLTATGATAQSVCASPEQAIHEASFVEVGGIPQWVTITGAHCGNPVILMLHGGPGNPLSPFADTIYAGWEQDFTLVQWDQRGAGMTWGKNRPTEDTPLTVEQMRDDGIDLAGYLTRHLGKRKVILMGGSWSSILGVHMVRKEPSLFYAYLGSSQIVSYAENQPATYDRLLALARAAGDQDSIDKLSAIGAPPWSNPRSSGVMRRVDRKYEGLASDPAPQTWWQPVGDYATPQARQDYSDGEDYSYVQFVGMKGDGMYSGVDLPKLGLTFEVPVYMVQGDADLLTLPDIGRSYFDSIQAPRKAFVVVPRAGHDPNPAMIAAQLKILQEAIRPTAE